MSVPRLTDRNLSVADLRRLRLPDAAAYGGKAAALGEMLAEGVPAFDGAALSVSVYEAAVLAGGTDVAAEEYWASDDPVTADRCRSTVLAALDGFDLDAVAAEILARVPPHAWSDGLIVRSSATVEDTSTSSYAGQFDSVHCQRGVADLVKAIRGVWRSTLAEGARWYRRTVAPGGGPVAMGVVVQPFAAFDIGGLLFTRHPTATVRGWSLVEFLDAAPSALVNGEVRPQRCRIAHGPRVVWEHRAPGHPELPTSAVETLLDTSERLRHRFGGDVDIEFGVRSSQVTLLQCRRVTAAPATGVH